MSYNAIIAMNKNPNPTDPAKICAAMGYFAINHPYANPLTMVNNTINAFLIPFSTLWCHRFGDIVRVHTLRPFAHSRINQGSLSCTLVGGVSPVPLTPI
jgi:hypothetical protein